MTLRIGDGCFCMIHMRIHTENSLTCKISRRGLGKEIEEILQEY